MVATHSGSMNILQLALVAAVLLGVLVVGLAAVVPNVLDWPTSTRH
jgi:hypothetical protein